MLRHLRVITYRAIATRCMYFCAHSVFDIIKCFSILPHLLKTMIEILYFPLAILLFKQRFEIKYAHLKQ